MFQFNLLTDNLKTYGFTDPVNFLENVLLDILKNVVPTVTCPVTTNAGPNFWNKLCLYTEDFCL